MRSASLSVSFARRTITERRSLGMPVAPHPAEPLEAVDQRGHRAGAERQQVAELARREAIAGGVDMVHRLEFRRGRAEAPRHECVEAVVLESERAQGLEQLLWTGHGDEILTSDNLDNQDVFDRSTAR